MKDAVNDNIRTGEIRWETTNRPKTSGCVKYIGRTDEEDGLREEIWIQNFFNGTVGIFCRDWETIV